MVCCSSELERVRLGVLGGEGVAMLGNGLWCVRRGGCGYAGEWAMVC